MASTLEHPLRIAFVDLTRQGWLAGLQYFENLFLALHALKFDLQPELVLVVAPEVNPANYQMLTAYVDNVLPMPPPPRPGFRQRQVIRVQKRLGIWQEPEPPLASLLRKHQVKAIFAGTHFGARLGLPLLAWIPDFQHLHLPELFSVAELQRREDKFTKMANHATRVILSSQDAYGDFAQFAPHAVNKARVLNFVAQVPADIYDTDPASVCDHYHLPRRFIYLPNQFWKHKNHEIVLQALPLAVAKQPEICVVCTGLTHDFRDSPYFSRLSAKISALNLRNHMIILGMVPHDHMLHLIRQSVAVLQPSLFEGWSTTVEETKSVGKCLLLSDIPVHREQNPPQAVFFNPHDPGALAECLLMAFDQNQAGPDKTLEAQAREQLPERTRQFGQTFLELVRDVTLR